MLEEFFWFCLRLTTGKNGRKLPGIGKLSTLGQDWKSFLRYFKGATKVPLDTELGLKMNKRLRKLAKEFGLDDQEQEKTPIFIEDLVPLQETTLHTQEKRFWLGLQRIQQCLYNVMACFTVNRINAMRMLQYKHLQYSLQQDLHGGPPRILLEITYSFAKKYMGVMNTFLIPEILFDPSLILSPHTFLLSILFRNDAFKALNLKSMEDLRQLFLEGGRQQLPLPLKREKADYYVFCRVEAKRGKVTVNTKLPITPSTLSSQMKDFGEIAGFLWSMFTHRFRYGGGAIMNTSGLVSNAQQNLIMKHASMRMFLNHYFPRCIGTDMQALMRGLEPDSEMMRAVMCMGHWLDPRQPQDLTDQQKVSVEQELELIEPQKDSEQLDKLEQLKKAVTNTHKHLLYALRIHIC
ncbi:uncharacterized protein TRUGW13939_07915 [Talaromyces rugulosus]|uniref:Uncharacterized protein n=1 Tax=Talaromyces rugulosus TaxID=121627 RepID=A0A7H8R310_TALRU|nr:uncharacterized protein TRUGW13939_07915 [Talaromyces rugulosus]QKX60769.1 hypothetical protein TRUGW13939_07915 [Talaromyces rugulosus]